MKQLILVGNQKVKFQDTETTISLTLVSDGNTVTIDSTKTYSVKIKNGTGYVKAITATPDTANNMVTFSTSGFDGLPVDAYFLELWVIDTSGQTIYPSDSFIELDITANATGVQGQVVPAITLQEFEDRFSTLQSDLEAKVGTLIGPTGATGNGISGVSTQYQLGTDGVNVPTGTWRDTPSTPTDTLPYMWTRNVTTYTDKSTHTSYNISAKGTKGNNFTIQGSTSSIAGLPSTGTDGEGYMVGTELYVWTNGKWNDIVNMKGVQGDQGIQGIQGVKGDTGTGIQSTSTDYELSSQGVEVPNTGWSTTIPVTTNDLPYLWTRVTITFTDSSQHVIYFTSNKGDKGDKGDTGEKGDTGANLAVKGAVDKATSLPSTGNSEGDAYLVGTDLYVYTKGAWKDCGPIVAENTVLYNTDGSLNVNGTNFTYVQDLRNGKIQYNDGTKNVQVTPMDADKEASDILAARSYTDTSVSALSTSVDTKLSTKANAADLSTGLATKVTDNGNGTIQVNGTQVSPYNKLTDTIGGRNLLIGTGSRTVTGATNNDYLSNETTEDLLTLFKGLEGKTVTVSVDYKYSGFIAGSGNNRLGWELVIIADNQSSFSVWYYPKNDSGSGRMSSTIVVPKNITSVIEGMGYNQFYGSGTGTLSHLKLEKGSVATDWTPAPEDKADDSKVNALQTQVNNSAVGTNLLLDTGNNLSITGTNISNQVTNYYLLANGYNVSSLASALGTQFTVSCDWSVSGSSPSGSFIIQWNNAPWGSGIGISNIVSSSNTSGHFSNNFSVSTDSANVATMIGFRLDNFVGTLTISNIKLEKGSKATDWCPNPDDKQDKISYTPADDSEVVHSTVTVLNSTDMNTVKNTGFYRLLSGTNGMPNADNYAIYQVISIGLSNGVQLAYGTNNTILGMRSWNSYSHFTSWVPFADDSKVAHLSGANNFDTAPTVNNNPLLLASSLPSTLADTTKLSNFTAGLQSNGTPVATSTDLSTGLATKADDSKVVHTTGTEEVSGQKTFDVAPIDKTTGNPYITKDGVPAVPSTLADTTKLSNFTAGLQSNGTAVATTSDVTTAISTATANSADVSKPNTFSKQQVFSTNPTNGTQVYPIYATADTDGTAATLIASLQSSGYSGIVGVPAS